jgi:Outer membrane protein and related peptidoglycan-associated (lipo)proteins
MKRILLFVITIAAACIIQAQEYDYPGLKQMLKGNYEAVQKDIDKHLSKDPGDVAYLYTAAKLYSTDEFSGRDIPKAYKYVVDCKSKFTRLEPAAQDKLIAKGLTKELLNTFTHEICSMALKDAEAVDTEEAYNNFLKAYPRAVPSLQRQAKEHLSHLAFVAAEERNTIGSYEFFIEQNPNGQDVKEAVRRRNALAYQQAQKQNNLTAYKLFIDQYPEAEDIPNAWQQVYALSLRDAQRIGTPEALAEYVKTYPDSPYGRQALLEQGADKYASFIREGDWITLKDKAAKKKDVLEQRRMYYAIMLIARKRHSAPAALLAYQTAPCTDIKDTSWMILHDVYCSTGVPADIIKLYDQYPNPRFAELEAHDRKVVQQYNIVTTTDTGWPALIRLGAPYKVAYNWMIGLIRDYLIREDIEMALQTVRPFAEAFGDDQAYNNLINALEQGKKNDLTPEAFPDSINSPAKEYSPVMTTDGNTIYFVRVVFDKAAGNSEDIYTATRTKRGWDRAVPMTELSVPGSNEAMQSVSADGTLLIFFRNGLLYSTFKTEDGWSRPRTLPDNINVANWQSDAMITSDGRAMLFSAQKQVENEVGTSVNIFVSLMDDNGDWGEPIDLGPNINTPGLERKPFLHPDMHTLYFSSDGHGTLGDLDVFKATRLKDDSWTEWSEPVNLGAGINSPRQEWGYKISTDGSTAYYSNGDDLYSVELPLSMRPNAVATISGTVRDETGKTVGVTIRWEDLESHESIGQSQTDPSNGTFYLVMPLGKNYGYYIDDERYFPLSNNIDLREQKKTISIEKNITLTSYKQMIEQGMSVQVNNLFFPVNEYELLPQSENELIRVADIIKQRNIRVEISGHTDSTGDAKKNMTLSKQRAESVRSFLIRQGCNASLLSAKGYGATRPIADNDTDEGKQQNRRVELQFLK